MSDRLAPTDAVFLHIERSGLPQHVGTVVVFAPPSDTSDGIELLDRVVNHVAGRIAFVPRYRKRLRWVPGGVADPVWVDDERFDLSYHVRRSALPRPGGDAELSEFVARVCSRPLDRARPLWELYVVDGVAGGGFAVVTKTHQSMIDGVQALDLAHVILDTSQQGPPGPPSPWRPAPEPSSAELLATALLGTVAHPRRSVAVARTRAKELRRTARRAASSIAGLAVAPRPPGGPLEAAPSQHRRFAVARTPLADYQAVARRSAEPSGETLGRLDEIAPTVNDVVLAALTGALRQWLQHRGAPPVTGDTVRALLPVSLATPGEVDGKVVALPVGEGNPLVRLRHITYQLSPHREGGRAVSARDLVELAGFAPPTLHGMGARAAARLSRRFADLVVSNVPGPQEARYAAGARLTETFPVIPLSDGHGLAVGVTSYDGHVFHGLHADRDTIPDLDLLALAVVQALAELAGATR